MICNVNGSIETGIGNLANVHLAAAAEPVTVSCVFPVSTPAEAQHGRLAGIYYKDDLLVEPMKFADGCIEVPTSPGMGIAPDLEKIRRYTLRADYRSHARALQLQEENMRQDIVERQAHAMREAGLDAIVSSSPENFAYVTGYPSPTQSLMRWRHAMALVTADAKVSLLVIDMEATTIRARQPGIDIAVWREFSSTACGCSPICSSTMVLPPVASGSSSITCRLRIFCGSERCCPRSC